MEIRDEFAKMAMMEFLRQGLLRYDPRDNIARRAYAMADAMIAARNKPEAVEPEETIIDDIPF